MIFDVCDLDSNGRLSQAELNLHTYLTANENLSDEEWKFVGGHFAPIFNENSKFLKF